MSEAGGAVQGSALHVVINNRVEATIDVDTMASKSCMTSGMLAPPDASGKPETEEGGEFYVV